jgi:hypothetical protein
LFYENIHKKSRDVAEPEKGWQQNQENLSRQGKVIVSPKKVE